MGFFGIDGFLRRAHFQNLHFNRFHPDCFTIINPKPMLYGRRRLGYDQALQEPDDPGCEDDHHDAQSEKLYGCEGG